MHLEKLFIQGIRNIESAEIELMPTLNIFYGRNGSGKTSVLEAVHILSRGRSFRTRALKSVITHNYRECTCFGLVAHKVNDSQSRVTPVGVTRHETGDFVFKVSGEQVNNASRLAEVLPVQLVNGESYQLLDGPPSMRRSYLDWGVFHVEHSYKEVWSRFQRCLKHRNSLLRHGKLDRLQLSIWDREYCSLSERIATARERYLEQLAPFISDVVSRLELSGDVRLHFSAGWDRQGDLAKQLEASLLRDQKAGFSHVGPHRAELKIFSGKLLAADVLSRGQGKMLVYALKLAQGMLFKEKTGKSCIYMLDDLPSELDSVHRRAVGQILHDMEVQVLVTGVEKSDLSTLWDPVLGVSGRRGVQAVFHVEQGRVTPDESS